MATTGKFGPGQSQEIETPFWPSTWYQVLGRAPSTWVILTCLQGALVGSGTEVEQLGLEPPSDVTSGSLTC